MTASRSALSSEPAIASPICCSRLGQGGPREGEGAKQPSMPACSAGLFDLYQLQGFAARAFDHHSAGVAENVGPFEQGHVFAAQFIDPVIEIGDAEPDVILQLAA